jgi:outer membrane protein TolC
LRPALVLALSLALPLTAAGGEPAVAAAKAKPAGVKLTVAECVLIALRNNIDLRRQRLSDRQAELDRSSALAEFLPNLTASGKSSETRRDFEADTQERSGSIGLSARTPWGTTLSGSASQSRSKTDHVTSSTSSVRAELRQPLLYGRGTAAAFYGYRAASRQRAASREDLTHQAQRTVYAVRQLYWTALKNQLVVAANRRALNSADYFLKATQARFKAERASKLDVSNAEIQRSSREVDLTGAEAQLEASFDNLKEAMDLSLSEKLVLTSPPEYTPLKMEKGKLLQKTLARRPDLRAARQRLKVKRLDLARKKRNAWPSLDLVGGYTWSGSGEGTADSQDYNSRKSSVGLELSVPLGMVKRRNDYSRAKLELRREQLGVHRREVAVHKELRSVLRDLTAAERNLISFEKRVSAARLAAAAARALYERGKASSFDVIRAEDDLLSAEQGLVRSRANCLTLAAELDLVTARPVSELSVEKKTGIVEDRRPRKGKLK